jgi:pimeloyl-ACP methyl ester carboxylesterase
MPKLAPLLARDFTVFMYDRRGRGDSGDTAPYAVEREIDDLDALIREAGGSAFVYAVSSGAALALEAAASRLSIKKLALYEAPFMVGTPAHEPPGDHQSQLVRLIAEGRRGDAVKYYMKDIMGMPALLVMLFRVLPMWSKLKAVAPSLPYDSAIMGDFSLPTRRVASLTTPTLVISGEKSMPVLRDAARALSDAIPGAQLRTLPGQTHNVAAAALAPVLKEFFGS